jgi:hypothetical protein
MDRCIGFDGARLDPRPRRFDGARGRQDSRLSRRSAVSRRIVPNSTAEDRSAGSSAPFGTSDTLAAVHRIHASDSDPEQRLEGLLAERRHDIEVQAARLEEAARDLERREDLLRDSRASLERLLRLGTSDLESREAELVQLLRDVTVREERLRTDEAELARRREELGAVELKRAAVEARERALADREDELTRQGTDTAAPAAADAAESIPLPLLAFVPGPGYSLRELESESLRAGETLTLDGAGYVVVRIGRSPLPGDPRRCAYLVRGPGREPPSDGSS